MDSPLYSASWYRVAELSPKLRPHAKIHRHRYRGQTWYALQDLTTQRFHRFSAPEHAIIGLMDGDRDVDTIWHLAIENLGDEAPTQEEMIELLAQLHAADVLQAGVPPDAAELLERFETRARKERRSRFMNPLAIRIPLFDPERFLERMMPFVRPLLGRWGAVAWIVAVVWAGFVLAGRWSELVEGIFDDTLMAGNLLLLWLSFPALKAFHELGHGFATKRFGGEVHDMGVMLLVLTPVPYVDASSSHAFAEKSRRMLVGAAGMIVEVFLAAAALILWSQLEPGVLRSLAYNIALIGGVSTVIFNANPLLRFDGYYILADWLEIPNLRARSNAYVLHLVERYAFGMEESTTPEAGRAERAWLGSFAVASFVYRLFVMTAILLFLLDQSFVLGLVLIAFVSVAWIGGPAWKGLRYLIAEPRLGRARGRAQRVVGLGTALAFLLLVVVPMPFRTLAEGVVWLPDEATVRVRTGGFVVRVVATPGERVERGDVLFEMRNPELERDRLRSEALLRELHARYHAARLENEARAQLIEEEIGAVEGRIARFAERAEGLVSVSGIAGHFVSPRADELVGRFVEQGDLLGHVLAVEHATIRTIVSDRVFELVRDDTRAVQVRLADRLEDVLPAQVARVVPAAHRILPAVALGAAGGGAISVDPRDEEGVRTLRNVFQLDLALSDAVELSTAGGRAYVRFEHGHRPLIQQWARSLRQLFLARFDV